MKLLRSASRGVEPWKNGRGQTATVEETADWRVSVAEVTDSSWFSTFPNVDRILMPLSTSGLVLSVNGQPRALGAFQPARFAGEDGVCALELTTSTEVLNLMWQRRKYYGELTAATVTDTFNLEENAALIVVVTAGVLTLSSGVALGRLDALRLARGEGATLSGSGHVVVARIRSHVDLDDEVPRSTQR